MKDFVSPDISKMQMVEVDERTKIYIPLSASPNAAKSRYMSYLRSRRK